MSDTAILLDDLIKNDPALSEELHKEHLENLAKKELHERPTCPECGGPMHYVRCLPISIDWECTNHPEHEQLQGDTWHEPWQPGTQPWGAGGGIAGAACEAPVFLTYANGKVWDCLKGTWVK